MTRKEDIISSWRALRADNGYLHISDMKPATIGKHGYYTARESWNGPIVSNITESIPMFLLTPYSFVGNMLPKTLNIPHFIRLPENLEDTSRGFTRISLRRLSYCITHFELSYFSDRFRRSRGPRILTSFMNCIFFNHDTESAFAWTLTVPRENSLEFQDRMLNGKDIFPPDLGMELWYCPQTISYCGKTIRTFFWDTIIYQAGQYGVMIKIKTPSEMSQLFTKVVIKQSPMRLSAREKQAQEQVAATIHSM